MSNPANNRSGGGPRRRRSGPRKGRRDERSRCRFCRAKIEHIDYKDTITLQKLVTSQGKMFSRKRSGNCARHQRMSTLAIKLARYMSLMPYVGG
jgi:small subunit ribosomal protein S18